MHYKNGKKSGFNLTEVVYVIFIMGILAGLMIYTTQYGIGQRVEATRFKKVIAAFNEAIDVMQSKNEIPVNAWNAGGGLTPGGRIIFNYLNTKRICTSSSHDCWLASGQWQNASGAVGSNGICPRESAKLADGTLVCFVAQNTDLISPRGYDSSENEYIYVVDLNGRKGVNTNGQDIFAIVVSEKSAYPFDNQPVVTSTKSAVAASATLTSFSNYLDGTEDSADFYTQNN